MLSQRLANIVFAILLVIACGYFAWVAQGFEASGLLASAGLPSKFFPQLILGCTALAATVVIFQYAVRGSSRHDAGRMVFATPGEARRGLLMLVVAIVCYFVWRSFGLVAMAVLIGPLSLVAMGVRNIATYIVVLAVAVIIYGLFTRFLGLQSL